MSRLSIDNIPGKSRNKEPLGLLSKDPKKLSAFYLSSESLAILSDAVERLRRENNSLVINKSVAVDLFIHYCKDIPLDRLLKK